MERYGYVHVPLMIAALALCSATRSTAASESEGADALRWNEEENRSCLRRQLTIDDLLAIREIGGMAGNGLSISPDGQYFALEIHRADVAGNTYDVAWLVGSTTAGQPVSTADGGEALLFRSELPDGRPVGAWISEYAKWSPDSSGIAHRKRLAGETQLWWLSSDGGQTRPLTDNAADIEDFVWNEDGSKIYFTTDADRLQLEQFHASRYRNGYVYDYRKDWSTIDGRPLYPPYLLTSGKQKIWVYDLESGEERAATSEEAASYEELAQSAGGSRIVPNARQLAYTDDGRGIAWLEPHDPARQGMYPPMSLYASLAPDASNPMRCEAEECTGAFDTDRPLKDGLQWRAIDEEVYFVRKEGAGYSRRTLYGWRVGHRTVREIFSTSDWISDCTVREDRALCFRETPVHPRTVISVDLKDGTIDTLVDPNPGFQCFVLGDVELLEWEDVSEYGVYGYLITPPEYDPDTRYPLVIVGYRARYGLRGGVGDEYPTHVLANNGFVVLVYDKPTTYAALEIHNDQIEIGKAMWGPGMFDVRMPLSLFESAIQSLSARGLVDPTRVGLTGLSNGVAHVNYALIHSNLFTTAIISGLEFTPGGWTLTGSSDEAAKSYRRAIGAGPYPGPDSFLLRHLSLGLNAARMTTPLLVNVADHEHVWGLEEVLALKEAGKPVEMVVYADEGHIKWHPAHRASVYERNLDWLRFWLLSTEDSDPAKREQYLRWRELRSQHASSGAASN